MPKDRRGFTLIELMISIAIIAVISTIGLVVYGAVQKNARISKRIQDLEAIKTALESHKATVGFYPNTSAATAGGFVCLESLTGVNSLLPSHMTVIPRDPSQPGGTATHCYQYAANTTTTTNPTAAAATEYKVRTNPTLPLTEMDAAEYRTQANLIDSDRDSTIDDACVVTNTGANDIDGWAIYTPGACNY